jgi:uncharacterized phiE125 gp8 family phage protein
MRLVLTSPPAIEPLLLDDAKLFAYIDNDATDTLITGLITVARQWVENYCNIALITQSYSAYYDYRDKWAGEWIRGRKIRLPMQPIQSITDVNSYDQFDNETLFDSSNYRLSGSRLVLGDLASWPTELRIYDCLQVDFVAGYSNDDTLIPSGIITAMKMLIASWYEQRGSITDDMLARNNVEMLPVPFGVKSILAPYRNIYLA